MDKGGGHHVLTTRLIGAAAGAGLALIAGFGIAGAQESDLEAQIAELTSAIDIAWLQICRDPVVTHWAWGDGFLSAYAADIQLGDNGFIDLAGSKLRDVAAARVDTVMRVGYRLTEPREAA